uniref:MIT domain-containing protein 1-like n=1 Tax=Phallusia mammillata TaxID=59560 RepID=A0A6F9DKY2_9ASCI|nr:MIT domain-containing protein 1-like [Phallusia mammillata]
MSEAAITGMEASAAKILTRAIEMERHGKYQTALVCYQEGIDLLLEVLKASKDPNKKKHYRSKIEEYMTQAEKVKVLLERLKQEGKYHEQLKIEDNATGHGYSAIFSPYMDETVVEVWIEDAYIRSYHQVNNFLRFCELLCTRCDNLKTVNLSTSTDDNNSSNQQENIACIARSLSQRGIILNVNYVSNLHDREIRFSNGWIIKVGRGLDYFKKVDKFCIGFHDMNQRPCHSTTVDIFHSKHTRDR